MYKSKTKKIEENPFNSNEEKMIQILDQNLEKVGIFDYKYALKRQQSFYEQYLLETRYFNSLKKQHKKNLSDSGYHLITTNRKRKITKLKPQEQLH